MGPGLRAAALAAATALLGVGATGSRADRAGDTLAVRDGIRWVTWWRRDAAPVRWEGAAPLAGRVAWRPGATGVEWGELQLRGASEAWRTRVVLVRIDPRQVDFSLITAFARSSRWTVADADSGAVVALDAGQFRQSLPWGWVVSKGREVLAPEYAPLAGAVVVDRSGAVRVIAPDDVAAERERGTAREAFQSYPMLLQDGVVPAPLSHAGRGVNVAHRDARLALGTLADGSILVALTRFDALGSRLGWVPFGLTSAEMAAVMGALGCRHALLLDGGISGQLLLREAGGSVRSWPGSRAVPLGLVARPKGSVVTD
jgi:hypothetical protein